MPSQRYWRRRKIERFNLNDAEMKVQSAQVQAIYNAAQRDIQAQITSAYASFSTKTGISVAILNEFINAGDQSRLVKRLSAIEDAEYLATAYAGRITRLEAMKLELHATVKEIYGKQVAVMTNGAASIIAASYLSTAFDIEKGTQIATQFKGINSFRLNAMLRAKWAGGNYSTRIWRDTGKLARQISTTIPAGLTAGKSPARLSREVRQAFNVAKYQADRLVRTETTYFENQAEADLYEEIGVEQYQYMAVMDSRTSHVCQDLNLDIFNLKDKEIGLNYPPMLPNCRSGTVSYFGNEFTPVRRVKQSDGSYKLAGSKTDVDTYNKWAKENRYRELMGTASIPAPNVRP